MTLEGDMYIKMFSILSVVLNFITVKYSLH